MSSTEASAMGQAVPDRTEGPDGASSDGWHRKPPEVPRSLVKLSQERARAESEIASRLKVRSEAAERAYREGSRAVEDRRSSETAEARAAHEKARARALQVFETDSKRTKQADEAGRSAIMQKVREDRHQAQTLHDQARWEAGTVFEASDQGELQRQEEWTKALSAEEEGLAGLRSEADTLLASYRKYRPRFVEPKLETPSPENPYEALRASIVEAVERLQSIAALKWPRSLAGANAAWLFIGPWLLLIGPLVLTLGTQYGLIATTVAAVVAGFGLRAWLYGIARRSLELELPPLLSALNRAEALMPLSRQWAKENHKRRRREVHQKREDDIRRADLEFAQKSQEIDEYETSGLQKLDQTTSDRLREIEHRRDRELSGADQALEARLSDIEARSQSDSARLKDDFDRAKTETQDRHESDWSALVALWSGGLDHAARIVDEVEAESSRYHLDWSDPSRRWTPPPGVPPAVRFGSAHIDLAHVAHGLSKDESLRQMARPRYDLPALLTFPDRASLLVKTPSEGRDAGIKALQGAMLRFLTSLPPGKVRFTIIDPVGLGRNFSAFMHLADYSELLVTSRIWTEPQQIENRLADVSLHMEKVIQQFLRNEYPTLEEYNQHAGEVAEPYRVVVVADFPSGFNDQSAQRLMSIATSGARCGVYTLIGLDTSIPKPATVNVEDLEKHAATLVWDKDHLSWKDPDFAPYPLSIDEPPNDEVLTRIMHDVGAAARLANRVEVPFEIIAPSEDRYWTGDTRGGIDVPLGRSGATKLQGLKLGKGTSQHVLTAGRTGSGKSTLLHALITNSSLIYSPDELELYLIDFKKGVEFKTYAQHALPHARVVAIESEREFGLSVLQRLDEELKRRGDIFRDLNVQDLNGYRNYRAGEAPAEPLREGEAPAEPLREGEAPAEPLFREGEAPAEPLLREGEAPAEPVLAGSSARRQPSPPTSGTNTLPPLPRVLLIVDEFQEFFVEDDKTAQDAALLLDRLVRQGRAFGVHVILGSQTLGGAFSLARSTLGQMAVRIALQCSEADAHLILSEDNAAARLLSRPGEAIYNDANGMVEGNHVFQVVWLSDDRKEHYLNKINELTKQKPFTPRPQIVFEGNIPADIRKNHLLSEYIQAGSWPEPPKAPQAWLGEAVAIKDPTSAVFRRMGGHNVLVVGQDADSARGLFMSSILSLAAQSPPDNARFYLLDGTPDDDPLSGYFRQFEALLPHPVKVGGHRDVSSILDEIAADLSARQSGAQNAPWSYLFIYDMSRFRDLRKSDDDFGYSFGKRDEPRQLSPSQQLSEIIREGPALGIHTIAWFDSLNNVGRALDRSAMREFEMRILFQMSANDSSNLIDSPVANRLGPNRAYFSSEEQGKLEKFRPYGQPDPEWLNTLQTRWRGRSS